MVNVISKKSVSRGPESVSQNSKVLPVLNSVFLDPLFFIHHRHVSNKPLTHCKKMHLHKTSRVRVMSTIMHIRIFVTDNLEGSDDINYERGAEECGRG